MTGSIVDFDVAITGVLWGQEWRIEGVARKKNRKILKIEVLRNYNSRVPIIPPFEALFCGDDDRGMEIVASQGYCYC